MTAPQCKPNILHPTVIPNWKMLTQQVFSVYRKCWDRWSSVIFSFIFTILQHLTLYWNGRFLFIASQMCLKSFSNTQQLFHHLCHQLREWIFCSWILTFAWLSVLLSCTVDGVQSRGCIGLVQVEMLPQSEKKSKKGENSANLSPITWCLYIINAGEKLRNYRGKSLYYIRTVAKKLFSKNWA